MHATGTGTAGLAAGRKNRQQKDPIHDLRGCKLVAVQFLDSSEIVDRSAEKAEKGA